jgi:hypothetical protein
MGSLTEPYTVCYHPLRAIQPEAIQANNQASLSKRTTVSPIPQALNIS